MMRENSVFKVLVQCLTVIGLFGVFPAKAATHYVWCGAGLNGNGSSFQSPSGSGQPGAFNDLPASLVRGDTYVVAGSKTSCATYYPWHLFDDPESGVLVITIRKANAAQDSAVAGWQARFATDQAEWSAPVLLDSEDASSAIGWKICRSYYTFDGITGTTDPSAGGPSNLGFLVDSPNNLLGHIYITTNSCGAAGSVTLINISIQHTEVNGVDRHLAAAVTSCSYSGTTVTLGTAATSYRWTNGNLVSGWDVNSALIFIGQAIANVSGQSFTVTNASNPCVALAFVGLDITTTAFYLHGSTTTYSNLTISHNYIHDLTTGFLDTQGMSNSTLVYNYFARNRSTPSEHGESWSDAGGSSNNTIAYNFWLDNRGSGTIVSLNSGPLMTDNAWNIYGNVFWQTTATSGNDSDGVITCLNGNTCSNWKIFNNTFYLLKGDGVGIHWGGASVSSTGILVYDNMWIASNNIQPSAITGPVCYDQTAACAATAQLVQDYNYYDTNNTGTASSDIHARTAAVNPSTFLTAVLNGIFTLTADGPNMLKTNTILPANTTDGLGNTRGGGDGTWDPGAFEFVKTAGNKPIPPITLNITGVR